MILRRRIMVLGGGDIGGYVDLGLPSGLMWAVGNLVKDSHGNYAIGAETDWGTYVSWGNIDGHNEGEGYDFSDANYKTTPGIALTADIPNSDSAHDICLARLGYPWHLPTKEDFQELYDNTDSEWVADYNGTGVAGRKFMKKSDHSIYVFFPASGKSDIYVGTTVSNRGTYSYYQSLSFYNSNNAYYLGSGSSEVRPQARGYRYTGNTVRPICKPMFSITITLTGEDVEGITITVRDSEGISHSGITNSNGVVQLTGVAGGSAKVFTKDYYVTPSHIIVNASSRTFTCGLEKRESKYLTFYSITDCTHKFTNAVNYSLDGGTTWQSLAANTGLTVPTGSSVMWKATITPNSSSGIGTFSVTDTSMRFDVEGNPMSLLYGDNFIGQTNLNYNGYTFYGLFRVNNGVVDAQNMGLPATTLANSCYAAMFVNCTSLTTAPELPATTLANSCYDSMFSGCYKLNYIKCLATDISATDCTKNWVSGVAASGTFTKAASMASWTTGQSGIPTGWTVETASS